MLRGNGNLAKVPTLVLLSAVVLVAIQAAGDPVTLFFYASYSVIGTLLAFRRPRNVVSWLLLGIAVAFVTTSTPPGLDLPSLERGEGSLRDIGLVWLSSWTGSALWLGYTALALVFPTGELPRGRERRLSIALVATSATAIVASMLAGSIGFSPDGEATVVIPNPVGVLPRELSELISTGVVIVTLAVLAVSVVLLLVRYRRANGVARLQIRWLLAAITLLVFGIVIGLVLFTTVVEQLGGLVWVPAILAYPMIPLAIAVAILRYRCTTSTAS